MLLLLITDESLLPFQSVCYFLRDYFVTTTFLGKTERCQRLIRPGGFESNLSTSYKSRYFMWGEVKLLHYVKI